MKITPINTQQNKQPHFNGFVDKKVLRIINRANNNEIKQLTKEANKKGGNIDIQTLENIKNNSAKIIDKLTNFMEKLHKDTVLTLNIDKTHLILKNLKLNIEYCPSNKRILYDKLNGKKSNVANLSQIDEIANTIIHNDPKAIDAMMFKEFTNNLIYKHTLLGRLMLLKSAKMAKELAPEFGQKSENIVKRVKQKINTARKILNTPKNKKATFF